jgi:hypothetical protein
MEEKYSPKDSLLMLEHCKKLNLKTIVMDERIQLNMTKNKDWQKTVKEMVADYEAHPMTYAYYLWDEPSQDDFKALTEIKSEFEKHTKKPLYVNLFPNYASKEQLKSNSYFEHVENFLKMFKPFSLGFDHYPFIENNYDRVDYFANLMDIRELALKYKTPFWTTIQSWPHLFYRPLSEEEVLWQVTTNLAYGAQGIFYFTYAPPPWSDKKDAMISVKGQTTKQYDIAKSVNTYLNKISKLFSELTSTKVLHTKMNGHSVVVGYFENKAKRNFVYVVNRDYKNNITIEIPKNFTLEYSVDRAEWVKPSSKQTFNKAEGKLYQLN